jgi:hypothetical protein
MTSQTDAREYAPNASGDQFQVFKTPMGHWRAHQVDGVERNYASIPASITAPTRARLLKELAKHWSN